MSSLRACSSFLLDRATAPGEVLSKRTAEVVGGFCNVCGLVELAVPGRVKGLPLGVVIADSPVVVDVDPDDEKLVIGQVLVEDSAVDDRL